MIIHSVILHYCHVSHEKEVMLFRTMKYCVKVRLKVMLFFFQMHPADTDGPKPHICKLCPIGFWSSGALQHHMKVAHSGDKSGASSPSRPKSPPKKYVLGTGINCKGSELIGNYNLCQTA